MKSEKSMPFIVAEMSGNHNQSLDRALAIVEAAAKAGVDAVKLQTYTADTMTLDVDGNEFRICNKDSLWNGETLYQLYKKAYTPWEWHKPIFERCKELGIQCFSTPFDVTAVDFLEELGVTCYKIASFENVDLPLIRKVAQTGKPMIISTGMATVTELDDAVRTARRNGCKDLTLLKCTSSYPATPEGTNLRTLPHMSELFGCKVGLSDHTRGIGVAVASVAFGSSMIEKHFTLCREDGGVDAAFSIEPTEMTQLVQECRDAAMALGNVSYDIQEQEKKSLLFRRSLYVVKDIKQGDVLNETNVKSIRPSAGIAPKYYDQVLGCRVRTDIKRGTPLQWKQIIME